MTHEQWKPTVDTYKAICYGFAMLALGMWFGNQFTGRLAWQEWSEGKVMSDSLQPPEWVSSVEAANYLLLAFFGLGMIAVLACDYYARQGTS